MRRHEDDRSIVDPLTPVSGSERGNGNEVSRANGLAGVSRCARCG